MRALVVVESMFGNTRLVAEAIAEGIYGFIPMDVFRVDDAPTKIAPEVALLVVGGPTHAFGMSRPRTREDAMTQSGEADAAGIGMREWLGSIEGPANGTRAAAFDTRLDKPRVPGSAARGAGKRLRALGFPMIVPAESFFVTATQGPLAPGEIERARDWGELLGAAVFDQRRPAAR